MIDVLIDALKVLLQVITIGAVCWVAWHLGHLTAAVKGLAGRVERLERWLDSRPWSQPGT